MTRLTSIFFNGNAFILVIACSILLSAQGDALAQRNKKHNLTGSVTDTDGKAVAGARIVLVHKSWPNNRFRMKTYASKTNSDGQFTFKNQYYSRQNSEFLVTVVADGHAMASDYIENPDGDKLDQLEFELEEAIEKTIVFNEGGKPLAKARVFAKARTTKDGDEHFIYPVSASKLTIQTDAEGKVKMNIFQPGDRVTLGMHRKGGIKEIQLTIDKSKEQSIGGSSSGGGDNTIETIVKDDSGKSIADAKILVSHKTWPNNRFMMENYDGETDDKGCFKLADVYDSDGRNGLLVSVLADGYVMQSQYLTTDGDELQPFEFELAAANSRKLTFEDAAGKAIPKARVLPVSRKDGNGDEHLIYPVSARNYSFKTDSNGAIEVGLFEAGDEVEFLVEMSGGSQRVNVEIDDSDSQTITVKKKLTP